MRAATEDDWFEEYGDLTLAVRVVDGFDDAVRKGVAACSPFPRHPSGKYPTWIDGVYRMYD